MLSKHKVVNLTHSAHRGGERKEEEEGKKRGGGDKRRKRMLSLLIVTTKAQCTDRDTCMLQRASEIEHPLRPWLTDG